MALFSGRHKLGKGNFPYIPKGNEGLEWGIFYNKYGVDKHDPKQLEARIVQLMDDEDVTKVSGIYEYLLDGDERHLSIRDFTPKMARAAYERQKGICPKCKKYFAIEDMQADHITPWSKGGKTIAENCQMLCANCNRIKSNCEPMGNWRIFSYLFITFSTF